MRFTRDLNRTLLVLFISSLKMPCVTIMNLKDVGAKNSLMVKHAEFFKGVLAIRRLFREDLMPLLITGRENPVTALQRRAWSRLFE